LSTYATNLAYLANDPHWVYVIWNGDECVYVGMTSDWRNRTGVHAKNYLATGRATHIDVWAAANGRADAETVEQQTIRDLDPVDNRQHSPRTESRRQAWAYFSEWRHAYERISYDYPPNVWALDHDSVAKAHAALDLWGYRDHSQFIPDEDHLTRLRERYARLTA
jgi:hypothetical protein